MNSSLPITLTIKAGIIQLLKLVGKGKSGYSYLAELDGQQVVYKAMHAEPVPYYSFSENKVKLEVQAYKTLCRLEIPVPGLVDFDLEGNYLVKEYLPGLCGHEWVAAGNRDGWVISQLFNLASRARRGGYNIDYFPPNFVVGENVLVYVDYEVNPYSPEWSLEEWGIYYWANQQGMANYLETGSWKAINQDEGSGKPIRDPFKATVNSWLKKYGSAARKNY